MLLIERRIWSGQSSSVDTTFQSVDPNLAASLSYVLTIDGSSFKGTIDIQGREDIADTWANIAYRVIDTQGGIGPLTTETLTPPQDTRSRYLIPISPVDVRLSLTRNSGTISAWVRGSATPILPSIGNGLADYYKLSTEPRPGNPYSDAATAVGIGAILLEYDTGNRFTYAGSQRGWVLVGSPAGNVEDLLERILHELALIRKGQELVLLDEIIA